MPQVSWAAATHPGLRRTGNEDAFRSRPDLGLYVVADGMGGHVAGEVASQIAVEVIEAFVAETRGDPRQTWPVPYDPSIGVNANRLRSAFSRSARTISLVTRVGATAARSGSWRRRTVLVSGNH